MKIPLSKPLLADGKELKEIDLDLANAPGNTVRRADAIMTNRRYVPQFKQNDTFYCGTIASLVTGIKYEELEGLPLGDFNLICNAVAGFLLNSQEATQSSNFQDFSEE